jgi:hypothetical protein
MNYKILNIELTDIIILKKAAPNLESLSLFSSIVNNSSIRKMTVPEII